MNIEPRPWQSEFVRAFKAFLQVRHGERGNTYSAVVCPGAGKTIAAYLAADGARYFWRDMSASQKTSK